MSKQRQEKDVLANENGRNIAVNSLLAFDREKRPIQQNLEELFGQADQLDRREKHLASELAYGSCRHLITLDYLIKRHSRRSVRHIDPLVRQILRVGLYQMLYLNRTPDFAAVSEAVQQAKACGHKGADKFINAILRAVQRDIEGPIIEAEENRPRATLWLDDRNGYRFSSDIWPEPGDKYG